ncbi:nucleolar complex protein 2 homolog [Punica granatum]|uniref:Nucleolar complex protein 2 homolog n=2 Tax=Punica granatum TaxID=22663 RepID=A0A6P8CMJ7_PUNGR|nr:nucleolar complex protein 2 homolog [Punica granatum]
MGEEDSVETLEYEMSEEEEEEDPGMSSGKAGEHKEQLQRLAEKDPEFYEFLKEHDKELLEFDDEDVDESAGSVLEDDGEIPGDDDEIMGHDVDEEKKPTAKTITTAMVDSWCNSIRESPKVGATRSLLRAFRCASHYGDDEGDESAAKLRTMTSTVFNKIMISVLTEMDGVLRKLLKLPASGGKKETIMELMLTRQWKNYSHMVKSYLGNALHILNQMTDTDMISFTLRRLKSSSLFLAAFPSLLRRYIKVVLHFWGTGGGALPVVSFLFLRDICIRVGLDCLDECFKGVYKAYIMNCQFVNATKLQHIQFLRNCVIELLGVDLRTAYQHAFVYIRQLGMILHKALTMKTKDAFRKVYEWKFMNCLELWTGAICAYGAEADFQPLAYPLTQVMSGVARLVPSARYFPLRLRCIRMLNRIAVSTGTFIPVSMLLLDMLEMKELNRPPTGGIGKAVDLRTIIKVNKQTIKTRAFQEECVYSVIEELAEHLAQWSYSVAFFELAFIPSVRLRSFCKSTKVERFRKEMRHLVRQINANSEFVNQRRSSVSFLPSDPAASSFLEDEKKLGTSPLSQYVLKLRQRAQQRSESLTESSVLVGERSSVFRKMPGKDETESDEDDDTVHEQGAAAFSSSWLPRSDSKIMHSKEEEVQKKKKKKRKKNEKTDELEGAEALEEDVVEDLVMSSDEEGPSSDDDNTETLSRRNPSKKQKWKPSAGKNSCSNSRKSWKRKKTKT